MNTKQNSMEWPEKIVHPTLLGIQVTGYYIAITYAVIYLCYRSITWCSKQIKSVAFGNRPCVSKYESKTEPSHVPQVFENSPPK